MEEEEVEQEFQGGERGETDEGPSRENEDHCLPSSLLC